MFSAERLEVWLRVRRERVIGTGGGDGKQPPQVLEGPNYLYRPEQILVNDADLPLVAEELKRVGAMPVPAYERSFKEYGIPVTAFRVPGVSIPDLVTQLRTSKGDGAPSVRIGPNHVFTGEPRYMGGPGSEPRPVDPPVTTWDRVRPEGPTIATLDTGIPADLPALHGDLQARVVTEGDDVDTLYSTGDLLDHEAGHGTFVSGIVMQLAPWLRIDPEKVLDPSGVGDDATVTLGLARSGCTLSNLSLGGYTHDDMEPPALQAFLDKRDPESVIVAAAGNNASDRPFWPAAFKHVIAVAAVDSHGTPLARAPFSNYGHWVDCCAPGVGIRSTYVDGEWRLGQSSGDVGVLEALKGWATWSGTSFATPHVTAAIAAEMRDSSLSPRQAALTVLAKATQRVATVGVYVAPAIDLVP